MDVDVAQTEAYYASHALCECPSCRNYYAQAKDKLGALDAFLRPLGVSVDRPDELGGVEMDGQIQYVFAAYTVCGRILSPCEGKIELVDGGTVLHIAIDNAYVPSEQKTEHFTVTVFGVVLPWVLNEPFPEKFPLTKRILDNIRAMFAKK